MASNDDMGGLNAQEHAATATEAQQPASAERQSDRDTGEKDVIEPSKSENVLATQGNSGSAQAAHETAQVDPAPPSQAASGAGVEEARIEDSTSQLPVEVVQNVVYADRADSQSAKNDIGVSAAVKNESTSSVPATDGSERSIAGEPIHAKPSVAQPPVGTPDEVRGNPYTLSGSLKVASHDDHLTESNMEGAQANQQDQDQGTAKPEDSKVDEDDKHLPKESQDGGHVELLNESTVDADRHSEFQPSVNENEEKASADGDYATDTGTTSEEDDEPEVGGEEDGEQEAGGEEDGEQDIGGEEVNDLQAQLRRKIANTRASTSQYRMLLGEDMGMQDALGHEGTRLTIGQSPFIRSSSTGRHNIPSQTLQRPGALSEPRYDGATAMPRNPQQHAQFLLAHPPQSYQAPFVRNSFGPNSLAPTAGMMQNYHPGGIPPYQQRLSYNQPFLGFRDSRYLPRPYGQVPLESGYSKIPMSPYQPLDQAFDPFSTGHTPQNGHDLQQQVPPPKNVYEEIISSDDDEPLRTRVPRHQSILSDSDKGSSSPLREATKSGEQQRPDYGEFEGELVDASPVQVKPKMCFKDTKAKKAAPKATPQPKTPPPAKASPSAPKSTSSPSPINWKLPTFEATFEPAKSKHDPTIAKISLPGLVREELCLSVDHAEQESQLIDDLFMPSQRALAQPDPEPARAILNFHTISVMVIEAFVQFEIGDEIGTGRGHWHDSHDQGNEEYERMRDARDADPDEMYFAVMDRWRAGIESNKQPAKMIRGVQEFSEVALDVIFHLKESGLVKERKRAVRSDRGVKKGARKVGGAEDEDGGSEEVVVVEKKGAKRAGGKVNEPKVTKKPKVAAKKTPVKKAPEKTKRKGPATVGVTVTRRK